MFMRATRALVSLENIKYNIQQVKSRVGKNVKVMAVVKANAYGHGLVEVAKYLNDINTNSPVDYFGVAIIEEGIALRESGIEQPILALTAPFEYQAEDYVKFNIEPAISSMKTAQIFESLGSANNLKVPIHIKVDTGMGRLGVDFKTAASFIKELSKFEHLEIKGVFSHFASSDEKDKTFTRIQLSRFKDIKTFVTQSEEMISPIFHIANSAAILDIEDSYFDMVRPGIMMYGYYPSHDTTESLDLKPALSMKSKISFIKTVEQNTSISYNRRYFTQSKSRIATIPIGYADGFYRLLTNKGTVLIKDNKFKISGTVCMDQVMVDLGNNLNIKEGDDVIFIGEDFNHNITAWDIADCAQTIPYEVCCSISSRVPRIYSDIEE
jgi:alanine racemase